MVIPFAPSLGWMRVYVNGMRDGMPHLEAALHANRSCDVQGKDFARALLPDRVLSVPLQGGSHALKSRHADPWLSDHGKWRREHLGAWNAEYGRTPFFSHLMPALTEVYDLSEQEPMRLEDFNHRMLLVALDWIDMSVLDDPASRLFNAVSRDFKRKVDDQFSIFDAIFRLGRYTAFTLRVSDV